MKLKSITIHNYKNIPHQTIKFDTDLTSLIIGQNGLGKSNLLEAITLIFVALSDKDDYLNLSNLDGRYLSFDLEYFLRGKNIKIIYGIKNVYEVNIDKDVYNLKPEGQYDPKIIKKINKDLIPDYFVTYYSGQNKRLEKILKKFEDTYIDGLRKNKETTFLTDRRNFLYLKNYHAPLLILTLSIFHEVEVCDKKIYLDKFNSLLKHLNIKCIAEFSLKLNSPDWIAKKYSEKITDEIKIENRYTEFIHLYLAEEKKYPFPFWGLKSSVDLLLKCLTKSVEMTEYNNEDDIKNKSNFTETIEFNNVSISELRKHIIEDFESPLELFYALEALVLLNILDVENNLKFDIKKGESVSAKNFSFEYLSEGENQFFIVLGIILATGIEETLFLLDEPDTYLNPKWQREYIHHLEEFNLEDDDSHILVTTHSPLLVQNIQGENKYKYDLILLSRNDNEIEFDQDITLFQNWRIDQVLSSKYFDLVSSRPILLDDYLKEKEAILYNNDLNFDDKKNQIDLLMEKYGNLPTGESRNEIQSMILINEVIKRFGK